MQNNDNIGKESTRHARAAQKAIKVLAYILLGIIGISALFAVIMVGFTLAY
jgi:hypothetical protein